LRTTALDNRLTDSGEVVNITLWLRFSTQEDFWYSFLLGLVTPNTKILKRIKIKIKDIPYKISEVSFLYCQLENTSLCLVYVTQNIMKATLMENSMERIL
jgi:hypothetical protein